ncbi:MAG: 7-cyano-7-deazaguanine reductase [Porticoccus sp.]|jgi:7-cyano-7-deazaguanine reductase
MSDSNLLLGIETAYPTSYCPDVLCSIPREQGRAILGIDGVPSFSGFDLWTAYELSWLDTKGKPVVAVADISMTCDTQNLVESKSLKLYLNSLNQERYGSASKVAALLERDISECVNGTVLVDIYTPDGYRNLGLATFPGVCLDDMDIDFVVDTYQPDPSLLSLNNGGQVVTKSFYSHLLKTNCPVTGQPDWASILIRYTGWPIDPEGLLKYIISYRNHQGFHEQCVEQIFTEINELCQPNELEVYARYTRRGGLDINPYRSSIKRSPPKLRLFRQ